MKRIAQMLMTMCAVFVIMFIAPQQAEAMTQADVEAKIAQIVSVYPTGSQFTKNGSACGHARLSSCSNCQLSQIPSRGGLPSGSTVSKVCVDGYTCIGFARYVFYTAFGISEKNSRNTTVNGLDTAVVGDYIRCLNGSGGVLHAGIFMGWATPGSTFYLYEANYGSPNKVAYKAVLYSATNHSDWKSFTTTHAYNYENSASGTPVEVSVSFADDTSRQSIGSTNATLAKTISVTGASINSVSEVGVWFYDSASTYLGGKREAPIPQNGVINAWYDVNSELGLTLSPSTTYIYQYFAVIAGVTYPSPAYSFTTSGAEVSFAFSYNSRESIGATNAVLAKTISIQNGSINDVTEVGMLLYNSAGGLEAYQGEVPVPSNGVINLWYDVNSEMNYTLTPATQYKYLVYAKHGGKTYYSGFFDFWTETVDHDLAFWDAREYIYPYNAEIGWTIGSGWEDGDTSFLYRVSSVGLNLYNASGTWLGGTSYKPYPSGDVINVWFNIEVDAGITLTPNTKYYYEITAYCDGIKFSSGLQGFTTKHVEITSLTLSDTQVLLDLSSGQTHTLSVTYAPSNATNTAISWGSSNLSVVTVSENGVLTPVGVGTAIVSCNAPVGAVTCFVQVVNGMAVDGITVSGADDGQALVGDTVTWTVNATSGSTLSYYYTILLEGQPYTAEGWTDSNTFSYTFVYPGQYHLYAAIRNNATQQTYDTVSDGVWVFPAVESISLNRTQLTLANTGYGSVMQLEATIKPSASVLGAISWTTSDPSVVKVNADGGLTAVAPGTAVVTVSEASGVSATCTVTVRDDLSTMTLPANTVEVSEEAFLNTAAERIIVPNGAQTIGASAFSGCEKLCFVVVPESVVTIGDDAFSGCDELILLAPSGSAAAQYAAEKGIEWFDPNVRFEIPVSAVTIDRTEVTLENGATVQLNATVAPANATNPNVEWASMNPAVATVNNGLVTAKGVGETVIAAVAADGSGCSALCKVSVTPVKVRSIALSTSSLSLNKNDAATITATVLPANAANQNLIWTSSNTAVATVSGGVVNAIGAGSATITASAADGSGVTASCAVTVTAPVAPPPVVTPSVTFTGYTCTPDVTDAYVYAQAVANAVGTFNSAGMYVWDAAGNQVGYKWEPAGHTRSEMGIWYYITKDIGVTLQPGSTYTWQMFTNYNGETYFSDVQTFTTLPLNATIDFASLSCSATETNVYLSTTATSAEVGTYTAASVQIKDSTGTVVASKPETVNHSSETLNIWYDVAGETGKTLVPGTTYTAQLSTTYNGVTYYSSPVTFTTKPVTTYNTSLSTATMINNLRNYSGISGKKNAVVTMAEFLLDSGYSPAFVAGVLGNLCHEGNTGIFEYYTSKHSYMVYMEANYQYKDRYSGKRVYDGFSLSTVKNMLTQLNNAGWPGKFGLGSLQWTAARTLTLVNYYIAEAGSSDTITQAQAEVAELRMIKHELESSYSSVPSNWSKRFAGNAYSLEAAFNAAFNFCTKFEKPKNAHLSAHTRAQTAMTLFNVMMGK